MGESLPKVQNVPIVMPQEVIAQWVETDEKILAKQGIKAQVPLIFMKEQ